MSVDRFRFVSPGIFINEIDQSQVPTQRLDRTGPAIIGLSKRGPAFRPVQVDSFDDFVQTFGAPSPGEGAGNGDDWRDGLQASPTYGAYAAQAYLANNAPVTFIRILGAESPQKTDAGKAGWDMPSTSDGQTTNGDGGVYALVLFNSGAGGALNTIPIHLTGTVAATWYVTSSASIALSGTMVNEGEGTLGISSVGYTVSTSSVRTFVVPASAGKEFKVLITGSNTGEKITAFNFTPGSPRYIRKVFNTSPLLLNSGVTDSANVEDYFLGESYDRAVADLFTYGTEDLYGVLIGLGSGSAGANPSAGDFRMGYKKPETPPIISQFLDAGNASNFDINGGGVKELFSLAARDEAEWLQNNIKISITEIKASPNPDYYGYGSFTIMVRAFDDSDETPVILEQWNNLSLDPKSNNYLVKRIGDRYVEFDSTNKRFREYGEYDNKSKYIRVKIGTVVADGAADPALLPFGFRGLPKYKGMNFASGSNTISGISSTGVGSALTTPFMTQNTDARYSPGPNALSSVNYFAGMPRFCTASVAWPTLPLRISSSDGQMVDETDAFFGCSTDRSADSNVSDGAVKDIIKARPADLYSNAQAFLINGSGNGGAYLERGPGFSFDNLVLDDSAGSNGITMFYSGSGYFYAQGSPGGSYQAGTSLNSISSSWSASLDKGYDRFTVPLYGGFDGLNIKVKDPLSNNAMGGQASPVSNTKINAMYYSVITAVDSLADPEYVAMNLAAVPGVWQRNVTNRLLRVCQDRADAMAVIDVEGDYTAGAENTNTFNNRVGSVANAVTWIKDRAINNSYGAAYYPWVQIQDRLAGSRVWVPPSVVVLGTYASSEARADVWFAPAGFNRGGLSDGAGGLPVLGVVEKLTSKQRDSLYEVGINPIASFPAEGIVVFGQKTLQATASALDRINVRRLLIFLKRRISRIAATILFDPNIQVTWNRFLSQVEPLLRSVKSRYGLADYRVILDNTTTTAEMVDRNVLYAKVFLQPTRAIEFIALDFIITRTGAAFND